jgi:hypothetical protein
MAIDDHTADRAWFLAAYRGDITTDDALEHVRNARRSPVVQADADAIAALDEGDKRFPDDKRRWPTGPAPWEQSIDVDPEATAAFAEMESVRKRELRWASTIHQRDQALDQVEFLELELHALKADVAAGRALEKLEAAPEDERDFYYQLAEMEERNAKLLEDLVDAELEAAGIESEGREPSTWAPVDLSDAWAGVDVPGPEIFARTDGVFLLYRGRTHAFQGESESCKSWAAQIAAVEVLAAGGRVLYIDFEDDGPGVVSRLRSLGAAATDRFVYLHPEEPVEDGKGRITAGGIDFSTVLRGAPYDLVIVDGVTEAMTTEGLDLLSNADIAVWNRRLPKRLAATGAAVVCIDHVTKNSETRGRYAIGGQHKLAGLTGAAYTFTPVRPLARARHEAITGIISVHVVKDRPGHVRGKAVEGKIATLELTSYPDGGVTPKLIPVDADDAEPAPEPQLLRRIFDHLLTYDGVSGSNVVDNVNGKEERVRSALKWMAADERRWIRVEKKGLSHLHWLTDEGREAAP